MVNVWVRTHNDPSEESESPDFGGGAEPFSGFPGLGFESLSLRRLLPGNMHIIGVDDPQFHQELVGRDRSEGRAANKVCGTQRGELAS